MEKKHYRFARSLFNELQFANRKFTWSDYLTDEDKHYDKFFEEILLKKLNRCRVNYTREDLDKIAECFQKIADNENSELTFLEYVYECVEGKLKVEKYIDKNEIINLSRFLGIYLKYIKASKCRNNNHGKQKFLFLSFDSNPEPGHEETIDGKGEALFRAISKNYELDYSSVTLLYENKVKEFFINKERKGVNWITSLDDSNALKNEDYDFIFLVNPKLCNLCWEQIEDGRLVENGIENFSPTRETMEKYGKALKPGGRMFFVDETMAADSELLKEVQSQAIDNKLYIETVINLYTFEPDLDFYKNSCVGYRNIELSVIVLQKGVPGTDKIKYLTVDNTMGDEYIENLIGAKYSERIKYKRNLAFFPQRVIFSDASDFEGQTDKVYYELLEKYYRFFYQDGENAGYVKLVKKLYDNKYSNQAKSSLKQKDWLYINDLARLAESLGLYYSGHQDLARLKEAKKYLEIATWCQMDVGSALELTEKRIAMKESGQSPFAIIKKQFTDLFPIDINENNYFSLYSDIEQVLKTGFGEIYWDRLQPETRVYIQTAVFSFLQFLNTDECLQSKFDYSGVISLLMRALELELKKRFCIGYMSYLRECCPNPVDFLHKNGLRWNLKDKDIKGIVKYVKDDDSSPLQYISYDGDNTEDGSYYFSMGKLNRFTGYKAGRNQKEATIHIDATFLEYLKWKTNDKAKRANHESPKDTTIDKKIRDWVRTISNNVDSMRLMRNNASHGGVILSIESAMQIFNTLILVRKVLKELVTPF